jgi:periplasmic protein TonB
MGDLCRGKRSVRLTDRPDVRDLATDRPALPDDRRREPKVGVMPAPDAAALPLRLDPTRVELGRMPRAARRRVVAGPVASVLLHLLPLLALVNWPHPAPAIPQPIPIRLVIEEPKPPPPPPPPPQPAEPKRPGKPPERPYASDDFAAVVGPKVEPGRPDPAPEVREAQPTAAATEARLVAPPSPPPTPISLPEPPISDPLAGAVEPKNQAVAHLVLPPPEPPKEPAKPPKPLPRQSEWPLPLHQDASQKVHAALMRGPDAIRDEYCAQALSLTLRHIGLLPRSATLAREGATVLAIHVLGDGTIDGVRVAHSSGYPDIDVRIERMVLEVGRYPPLPTWMGPSMDFTFQMHFPNQWQQ